MVPFREHHLYQIFDLLDQNQGPLDLILSQYFRQHKALGSKDRSFLGETLFELVRYQNVLDHFISKEKNWASRFSILKKNHVQDLLKDSSLPVHIQAGWPKELYDLLVQQQDQSIVHQWGQLSFHRAPITLRVNTIKISREEFLKKYASDFEMQPTKYSKQGIHILKRKALFQHPAFQAGYFEMQDEASQLIGTLVQAKPKEKVLDYCSGSGGKALAIAPFMNKKGVLYLHDIRAGILSQAKKRCKRAGIENVQIYDSCNKHLKGLKGNMDWVLVDAPCSGSGTYRRNPDLKWKFSKAMLQELVSKQRQIFEKALSYLKPNGKIIYATCSLLKEENEKQAEFFMQEHQLKLVQPYLNTSVYLDEMDGFFGAVFEKR